MKKILLIQMFIAILALGTGCDKYAEFRVETPDFNILPFDKDYHAGDVVCFRFSGDADIITFYSDERGDLEMSFSSQTRYGGYANFISVQTSADFSGEFTGEAISAATWRDISERFTYAVDVNMTTSGRHSIYDIVDPGSPLWIAFKYKADGPMEGKTELSNWWIQDARISLVTPGASTVAMDQYETTWTFVNSADNPAGVGWGWNADGKRINFIGNTTTAPAEGWAIAEPIDLSALSAAGNVIKKYIDPPLTSYEYVFNLPGEYDIVFEATNVTGKESKHVTRSLKLTINP